jgi:hypothetical protein
VPIEGVDYSSARPDPVKLYAAGKRFVVRYGGPGGDWKHLTQAEADALTAAGLALVANAEGTASGLVNGWSTGVAWASSADAAFQDLGMPATKPIYLSVDFDCGTGDWPKVADALRGAASVIGAARVGVYGSFDVMNWAKRDNVARWFWQTYAWSAGRWAAHNHIEQYNNGETVAGTAGIDLCRAMTADYGQWGVEDMAFTAAQEKAIADAAGLINRYLMAGLWRLDALTVGSDTVRGGTTEGEAMWTVKQLKALMAKVAALPVDPVDEQAVATAVLATLTPAAIAAAIPDTVAAEVADELAARLTG